MTKEELMALKLRQMMPYLQMHEEATRGRRFPGPVQKHALTLEEAQALHADEAERLRQERTQGGML